MRLTQIAHQLIEPHVKTGNVVVDATAGNGHDTLFLARHVGPSGRVYAFDIQKTALDNTRLLIEKQLPGYHIFAREKTSDEKLSAGVALVHDSHAAMNQYVHNDDRHHIAAVVFNLGYLPGSNTVCATSNSERVLKSERKQNGTLSMSSTENQRITTQAESTVKAIRHALALLKPGGIVSVLAYVGHPGGEDEARAVVDLTRQKTNGIAWREIDKNHTDTRSPRLFVATASR